MNENSKNSKSSLLSLNLFFLALLLKPFYILPSGSFQLSDFFIVLAFFSTIKSGKVQLNSDDKWLYVFIGCISVINTIYSVIYQEFAFIRSIAFFLFSAIIVIIVRNNISFSFYKKLSSVAKATIIIQLIIYFLHIGRWLGAYRYMGTYNDPNQFAFGIFSSYLVLYCVDKRNKEKTLYLFFIISVYLIYKSDSMGMLLGMLILFIADIYTIITNRMKSKGFDVPLLTPVLMVGFGAIVILIIGQSIADKYSGTELFQRFTYKLNKEDGVIDSFIRDRHLTIFFENLSTVLYGSGEGLMMRFSGTSDNRELHSTWIALLFYYGIIPFSFLLKWVTINIKRASRNIIPAAVALIIEAITLVNHRQPVFWILFLLFYYSSEDFEISSEGEKKYV